jgi:hypothetical protein
MKYQKTSSKHVTIGFNRIENDDAKNGEEPMTRYKRKRPEKSKKPLVIPMINNTDNWRLGRSASSAILASDTQQTASNSTTNDLATAAKNALLQGMIFSRLFGIILVIFRSKTFRKWNR